MKTMKTTIAATVALATLVGTQLHAQNIKIDNITLSLTLLAQSSVSTSGSAANAGLFSQGPKFYRTSNTRLTQAGLLRAIAIVYHGNPNYYSGSAVLQLVQGELGGFWNINDGLAQSFPDYNTDGSLAGTFNSGGTLAGGSNPFYGNLESTFFPLNAYGFDITGKENFDSVINNVTDNSTRISVSDGVAAYARLDTGRHFLPVPWASYIAATSNGVPFATTGEYPVGHMQPWGQVFVKDPGHKDSSGNPECDNVTFFFDFEVSECYDCFYLSSFISDATFRITSSTTTPSGPPCCSGPQGGFLTGSGTDRYYMSMDFDNTLNNSYLNPATNSSGTGFEYGFTGFTGLSPTAGVADGLTPDLLVYSDSIKSGLGSPSPFVTRLALKGVVTYNWTLKKVNTSDVAADYVGRATYAANGYGFVGLVCDIIPSATMTFAESIVKNVGCCDNTPWQLNWYGPGWDGNWGYFNPVISQYNPYPFFNIVGGFSFDTSGDENLPYQFESPYNPAAALTRHSETPGSSSIATYNFNNYIFDFNNAGSD